MRRSLSPLVLLFVLGACANNVQTASLQADSEAKRFDQPQPDKAALYIYRRDWFGMARPVEVGIVGGVQTRLAHDSYFRVEGPPGPIEIGCKVGDSTDARQIEVGPGQTRYLEVSMRAGLWGPNCQVTEVSPQQGQAGVLAGKRVEAL